MKRSQPFAAEMFFRRERPVFRTLAEAAVYYRFFRYNENHDPDNGEFASGDGGSGGGGGPAPDASKTAVEVTDKSADTKSISDYSPGIKATTGTAIKSTKTSWFETSPLKHIDDVIAAAPFAQKELGDLGKTLAEKYGVKFKDPGVKTKSEKGIARTKTKIAERGGVAARVTDVVRATFIVSEPSQADAIAKDIAKKYEVVLEDWKQTPLGYFDRAAVVRFPNGATGEIQFMDAAMANAKSDKGGNGHGLYVEWRALDPKIPEQRARADELHDQMVALYGAVSGAYSSDWKAVLGKSDT